MKPAQVKALLTRLENAARDDEWRGSAHPDDRDDIHDRYLRTRRMVETKLLEALQ